MSFTFRCALIFVDTYAHTLFLEVNSIFQYAFVADDELRLHKRAVSINYLLRVVLDFNSVMFMFYFNWMCVNDYCIL